MNQLTTRELLYLEDTSKLFESIMKNCNYAFNAAVDPEFKNFVQSVANERRQWITANAAIINNKVQ